MTDMKERPEIAVGAVRKFKDGRRGKISSVSDEDQVTVEFEDNVIQSFTVDEIHNESLAEAEPPQQT